MEQELQTEFLCTVSTTFQVTKKRDQDDGLGNLGKRRYDGVVVSTYFSTQHCSTDLPLRSWSNWETGVANNPDIDKPFPQKRSDRVCCEEERKCQQSRELQVSLMTMQ